MTIKTAIEVLVQSADELGIPRPAGIVAMDPTTRQLVAYFNKTGRGLVTEHNWKGLETLIEIPLVAGVSTYPLPPDYDRLTPETAWDSSNGWPMLGPDLSAVGRWRRENSVGSAGPRRAFQIRAGQILIFPTPASPGVLTFEYIRNTWCFDVNSQTWKDYLSTGDDTTVYHPDLMVGGVITHFKANKGFDAMKLKTEFDLLLKKLRASDATAPVLNMAGTNTEAFLNLGNVPDAGYGG